MPAGKTARVCNLLRRACIDVDEDGLLETILTTHIKMGPAGTEQALERVLAIHAAPVTAAGEKASANEDRARAALKYMLLLVDVDTLYGEALGSYNLEFALMVAQVAQMDPKQYLPFLNALRTEEEQYRRYRIDMHLKRYARALENLTASGPRHFDTCLQLIKEHELYPEGMRIYEEQQQQGKEEQGKEEQGQEGEEEAAAEEAGGKGNGSGKAGTPLQRVASAYGEYLMGKREYEQAGIVFEVAHEFDQALVAYARALNWRQAFCVTAAQAVPVEEVQRVARDIAENLLTAYRFEEAGRVLEEHAGDVSAATEAYVRGKHWDAAFLLASKQARGVSKADLMDRVIAPGVRDALCELREQFGETAALISRRTERLAVVRAGKLEKMQRAAAGVGEGGEEGEGWFAADGAASDLYSDASTAKSRRTGGSRSSQRSRASTAKSSRGRRKHEGKKFSLKEGGVFEEEALVHSLQQLVLQVDRAQDVVRATLLAGMRVGAREDVDSLQETYHACRQTVHACLPSIWPPASRLLHRLPATTFRVATAGTGTGPDAFGGGGMSTQAQALLDQQRAMHVPHLAGARVGLLAELEAEEGEEGEEEVPLAAKPEFKVSRTWRVITEKQRKAARD